MTSVIVAYLKRYVSTPPRRAAEDKDGEKDQALGF